ncbi:MAG: YcjF family protein [Verrucomicrobia bacterium]|jgi:uncharacterized membrane protein YcjF (UPF0283 family)|nr:YcjF family protein [Verrucomicrobiota bacterium]MBT7068496.1 YcjF family protein [Verrucomicrobiota bacterium]MBT7699815.1 YcjF family protein [Verrucomicrobiota bacterium]
MNAYRYSVLGNLWRATKVVVWGVGIFLAFAALIECVQAYQVLGGVHPLLGWLFLVVLLGAVGWAVAYYTVAMTRRPAVLLPPPRRNLNTASRRDVQRYARYLVAVMNRLAENAWVAEAHRSGLRRAAVALKGRIGSKSDRAALVTTLVTTVDNVIIPAVEPLDEVAAQRVRTCVRDTMLGVTVSPWRSMDLLVVLYRNGQMVLEVSSIYNGRPGLREQGRIFADVLRVAATVQFLNIGSKLVENLTSWIPVLGRFTDDIAQGIGAGLFTSVTGYATIDRCRAFRGWDEAEARSGMAAKLKQFMADLKGIVSDLILPALKGRIEAETPEERRAPNFMDRARSGINDAIDATSDTLDSCVRKPVLVGYKGVATTGAVLWRGTRRAGAEAGRAAAWTGRQGWRLSSRGVKLTGRGAGLVGRGAASVARKATRLVGRKRAPESESPEDKQ